MIQKKLQQYVYESLVQMGDFVLSDVLITAPSDASHGDYMTSVALSAGKKLQQNPQDFAATLAQKIQDKAYAEIQSVSVAGPGFINITITPAAVRAEIASTEKLQTKYTDKKVLVEHSSPNLFKPFHIGHLMNNVIGEAVVRMTQAGGGLTTATSFPSDVSIGIAKAVYMIQKDRESGIAPAGLEDVTYLGQAYTRGVAYYEEHPSEQEAIKTTAQEIYSNIPGTALDIYTNAKAFNIDYFTKVTRNLGSEFDSFIYESESGFRGIKTIQGNPVKITPPFVRSEGAVVYIPDESRKDINTTVFINSQGNPTYAGKDIGLIDLKFERYNPDVSIYITDNEQIPHFRTVFAAAEEINKSWRDRISRSLHVPHGRMTFKGAKMSSRLGGVPLAEDTIDAVLEEVRARSGGHIDHLPATEQTQVQRGIALGALRIAILRAKPGSSINFDPETSLSFEGDSGPYLLYTHARCASLLDKGAAAGTIPKVNGLEGATLVERKLMHYREVLEHSIDELAPQKIVTYLFELAQEFNSFYNDTTIIVEGDKSGTAHRLYIAQEVKNVLRAALYTLGINAPERM
jgi:arginyl-tRNA synthetase